MNKRLVFGVLTLTALALLLAGLACGRGRAAPTAAPAVGGAQPPTALAPTTPPEPTSTPVPGGCADGMQFVADVTVPDGTVFAPGESFTKTWRVRNSGSCDWTGYRLVFDSGEPMGTMEQVIADTPAGGTVEISVEMTAPGGAGRYRGYWRIESPDGANLGRVYCDIVVEGGGSAPPPTEPSAQAPTAPDNLRLVGWTMNTTRLGWDDHSDNEQGFRVYLQGEATAIAEVGANQTEASLPILPCGQSAQYVVRAYNSAGESASSNVLPLTGPACAAQPQTITLQSLPAEDGYVRGFTSGESLEMNGNIEVGDGTQNRAKQGFLSFDVSVIPAGATIQQAVLDLSNHTIRGDPFGTPSLGRFGVYVALFNPLGVEHYVAGFPPGPIAALDGPPGTLDVTNLIQPYVGSSNPRFQLRLQFEAITDNDGTGDCLVFPEGGPALTITYLAP